MQALLRYFASRHVLANVFTLMVVLLGLSTLPNIQRDSFPSVDLAEMVITTRYPGASPQDVELNVTNKIEEELKEVDGLKRVTSFSMENISVIDVKIDLDTTDLDKVKTDVRDAVSRTRIAIRSRRSTSGARYHYCDRHTDHRGRAQRRYPLCAIA